MKLKHNAREKAWQRGEDQAHLEFHIAFLRLSLLSIKMQEIERAIKGGQINSGSIAKSMKTQC